MTTTERLRSLLTTYQDAVKYSSDFDTRAHIHAGRALANAASDALPALLAVVSAVKDHIEDEGPGFAPQLREALAKLDQETP